jgi:hypothetical protein
MAFSDLKRSSSSDFDFLQKELESKDGAGGAPSNEWKPALNKDKTGGGAIIRFLPAPAGENAPMVKLFQHVFQGPDDSWFIENCPTTIGGECPVCAANRQYYKNNQKELAAGKSRKKKYIANILVIKDPANPDNEGKVMQWRFGQQIFDIIARTMKPEEGLGDEPIPVFNFWKGANFRLRITMKGQYWNYESSSFEAPTALSNDDDELESIYNQLMPLAPIVADDQFKSYDELEKRLSEVMNPRRRPVSNLEEEEEELFGSSSFDDEDDTPAVSSFRKQMDEPQSKDADYFASLLAD